MTRELQISRGMTTLVDNDDFERLSSQKWTAFITRQGKVYARGHVAGKNIFMHRFLMGAALGQFIDHRDGNGLNNTKSNLRFCTRSQNGANARYPLGASGLIGVKWCPRRRNWRARYSENGKDKEIPGVFKSAIDAALARGARVMEIFGEFAVLNFPKKAGVDQPVTA